MTAYSSNISIRDMAARILAAERVLITTHIKPDGDAIGSTLGLARALKTRHKTADIYYAGPIEPNLVTIIGTTPFHRLEHQTPDDAYDLAIVTDTGAWTQLEQIAPWLKRHHDRVVGIDHHTRGDEVAAARLVDPHAVSTTAMLVPLLDEMRCELTGGVGGVAEPLFVGLATDSGWFRYGNAGVEAFQLGARLLSCGVNKDRLYQILEETHGPQRLALEARALASLQYVPLRRTDEVRSPSTAGEALHAPSSQPPRSLVAIQSLRPADFQITGASAEDVTGLVNTPMTVGAVRVSILLTQMPNALEETKISFRSKPPLPDAQATDFIDVNVLANTFGGGGHVHAAGARMNKNLNEAKAAVIEAVGQL